MTIKKRKIGNTNLEITELGFGTAPLGVWPIKVSENDALSTLENAWEKGIRYFDTAPLYGTGMAEERLGKFLKTKNRNDFVVATKVGRLIVDTNFSKAAQKFIGSPKNKDSIFDFSYDGIMKSFEDSLQRLQLDYVDVLHLHDPYNHPDHFEQARKGAIKAMIKLKDQKAEAVFVSCTALRVVEILNQVEKIISKPVISSNQALIWDTLRSVNIKDSIKNYGQLFLNYFFYG